MAKTCIWSTAQAVTAGPEASVPPRDSGGVQAPSENAEWARALSESTQKRSIRPSPHETAAVASNMSHLRRESLLRRRERPPEVVGHALVETTHDDGCSEAEEGGYLCGGPADGGSPA